jgi:hypothetical protein
MRLQISDDGYVTLSQYEPEEGGRIIVHASESIHDTIDLIVKACGGRWRSRENTWAVHYTKGLALFEAVYELNVTYNASRK